MATATCAKCGDLKELCRSLRIDGLQQPRFCKDCLMEKKETPVNDLYWIAQMGQLNDTESIAIVREQLGILVELTKGECDHASMQRDT